MTNQLNPSQLPTDALRHELQELVKVLGQRTLTSVTGWLGENGKKVAGQVQEAVTSGGAGGVAKLVGSGVKDTVAGGAKQATEKVKEAVGGESSTSGGNAKVTNIVEEIDVGVPVPVAYNQWTRFTDFPSFMKKIENVDQESDTELKWRGKILWSHRDWTSTIVDQVPDERIVWKSEGAKGYVDGAVTFHELAPNLTRILLVLEYYPNGFFEKTGNLWRAQGRRARLELKHFRRHVMTRTILHPEEVEGWRGEVHDSEVQEQQPAADQQDQAGESGQEDRQDQAGEQARESGQEEKQDQHENEEPAKEQATSAQ